MDTALGGQVDYEVHTIGLRFDPHMYRHVYRDVDAEEAALCRHYCAVGWKEGRNPNRYFDTVSYLLAHKDVAEAGINPFFHYLMYGLSERRAIEVAALPAPVTAAALGTVIPDWVSTVREHLDPSFYRAQVGIIDKHIDLAAHYAFRGWREGLKPNRSFDTSAIVKKYPLLLNHRLNPLIFASSSLPLYDDAVVLAIAQHFDAELYRQEYVDLVGDDVTLMNHFCTKGWKEGRNPTRSFDTVEYILSHPVLVDVGLNPFFHYVKIGQSLGFLAEPAVMPSDIPFEACGAGRLDWVAMVRDHLDVDHYIETLGVSFEDVDLAAHYAFRGWREMRNPNRSFNTSEMLREFPRLGELRCNPLIALLVAERLGNPPPGERPDSQAVAAVRASESGCAETVGLVSGLSETEPASPVEGNERDRLRLNSTRFPASVLSGDAQIADLSVPHKNLSPLGTERLTSLYNDHVERDVANEFDAEYYLSVNIDVRDAEVEPLQHYIHTGWKEGRNPSPNFSTGYYLKANPDVEAAGVHPFWHYIVKGRSEGRLPVRPGGYRRDIVEALKTPDEKTQHYTISSTGGEITIETIQSAIRAACSGSKGVVLSISHDCYLMSIGGIQLFIADEQLSFNAMGLVYINISPVLARLALASGEDGSMKVQIVLDGKLLGTCTYEGLRTVLEGYAKRQSHRRIFAVHCLLGHEMGQVISLQRVFQSDANYFWLHDYSSVCPGFNLLRNDVEFCGAPPAESMSCRVCIYGATRAAHVAAMRDLFEAVPISVVAPSRKALKIWQDASDLPHIAAVVHEHCRIEPTDGRRPAAGKPTRGSAEDPVRVAFIGHPVIHKGWPIFRELAMRLRHSPVYKLFHFASRESVQPLLAVEPVITQTTATSRYAMTKALAEHSIDLVLVLSFWPETFSYVTYEALAAGADIVALEDSGNVADTVLRLKRGVVASCENALYDFFTSYRAVQYVRLCHVEGIREGRLVHCGTTATIDPARHSAGT